MSSNTGAVRLLRLLLVAAVTVPALTFVGAAWQDRRVLMSEATQRAEKSAEVLEEHAGAAFHAYELIFARVDEHLRAAPNESEADRHAYLMSIDHGLKEVGSLFLADTTGRVTSHSRFFPAGLITVSDRDYFRTLNPGMDLAVANGRATEAGKSAGPIPALDASGLAVGTPNIGRLSGSTKVNIARAITSPDGHFGGAVVISVAPEYMEAFHRKLAASADDSMALIRTDGAPLARSPALTDSDLRQVMFPERMQATADRLSRGSAIFTSPLDHVERIVVYRKLADYPIFVAYGLSTSAVLAVWHDHLVTYAIVAAAAAFTLLLVTLLALKAAQQEGLARASLVSEMGRREAAEAALRQAQKMEAIGQLTGGIAHDFNNLLAAVLGNLELLAKRIPDDPRLRRYVEGALEGARRGAGLTQRMLAFARRQELKFKAVDVPDLIRGMSDLLERSIGPSVSIETRFPVRITPARADANQLEAALLNLAVNARDAMPKGGRIVISGREAHVGIGNPLGLAPGGYVVLTVTDMGAGMDAETIARATEPFFTTKAVGKGTGLGLAMVHGFAAQSGGTLRIESTPGVGTTIEIWLPVAEPEIRPISTEPPHALKRVEPLRVLLADDDRLVREGTSAMLEDLGNRVVAVSSAAEVLAKLNDGEPFDLLITDYLMPGMTGLELADQIRDFDPQLPVLLVSGFAEMSEEDAARLPRLAKPFSQDDLAGAIAEVSAAHSGGENVVALQSWDRHLH